MSESKRTTKSSSYPMRQESFLLPGHGKLRRQPKRPRRRHYFDRHLLLSCGVTGQYPSASKP